MDDNDELREVELTSRYYGGEPDTSADTYTVLDEFSVSANAVNWVVLAAVGGIMLWAITKD